MSKFVIYKLSEWSGEADYFVKFTEEGHRFGYISDAMIMSEKEADRLISEGVATYKEKIIH